MSYKLIAFIFFEIIFLIKGEQVNQIKTSIRQLQSCGDGKYFDSSSNVCSDCIANCKTCLSNDKCQFCQSTYFLNYSDSTCVDCKQDGVYIELYLCKKCDISCKQCSGFLDTQCTACYDGLYLDKTSGKCTNCLQQGVYKTLDKMCLKCDTSCKNCSGGDANQCTECEDGFFLQKDLSNNPNTCQKCHISCNTCDGATQNNCLSCSNGLLKLYKGTEFQKQCTNCNNINVFKDNDVCQLCESSCVACLSKNNCQGCVDGYYQNQQNTICDQCHPTCRQCSSSFFNNCIACYSNSYLKSDNTCQLCDQSCQGCKGPTNLDCNDCNIGYSFKYQECIKCDNSCAKCNGEVPTQCKKCYDNKYLTIDHQCTTCLENGWFISGSYCLQCQQSCLTCQVRADFCLTCPQGKYLYPNNTCAECPIDKSYFIQNNLCLKCSQNCLTCNLSDINCLTCQTGLYLDNNNKCVSCDLQGQFIQGNTCKQCDPSCLYCSGTNTNCTKCQQNLYLSKNNQCIQCNGIGQFISGFKCIQCDISCATCDEIQTNKCLSCSSDKYLNLQNQCTTCKEDGVFISPTRQCLQCDSTCLTCKGATQNDCIKCQKNLYFNKQNLCISCYQDGFFISGEQCLECDSSCLTCSGTTKTDCLTCKAGFYLSDDKQCVKCDQDRQFQSDKYCKSCDSSCLKCNGTDKNNCTQCDLGLFLSSKSECVSCTEKGQSILGTQCIQCDSSCLTCNGTKDTNCLTCNNGQYITQKNQCSSCQDDGYFISLNQCLQCDPSCLKCNGTTNKDCLSCPFGKYLDQNNSCVSCKYDGFFISEDKCLKCDSTCVTCNGTTNTDCLSCSKGQFLLVSNSTCVNSCDSKNGFYILDDKCIECDKSCKTCNGQLETNCLSCYFGLIFQPTLNKCGRCEEGQYLNKSTDKCEYCDQSCLECTGKNKNECKLCANGLILSKVTNTCENSSIIKSQQDELESIQKVGCLNQQNKSDQDCMSRIETSESQTQILNILSISNIVVTIISSTITSFGALIGQIFIQNSQSIGNYIFASNLNPLQMNQFELKTYYAYHIFTVIPNMFKSSNGNTLYSFKLFNTLIPINDFSDSYFNNCCMSVLTLGVILVFTIIIFITSSSAICKNNQMNSQNSKMLQIYSYVKWNLFVHFFRLASSFLVLNTAYLLQYQSHLEKIDLIFMAISMPFYIIIESYWSIKIGPKYYSISSNDLAQIDSLTQKIEISDQLSRVFWIFFEWKKVIITVVQSIFIFTKNKQHLSCWIHSALNVLFIVYVSIKNPFIEKKINYFVILQEILHTVLVILIGVILAQDSSQYSYSVPSLQQNMQQVFRYLSFGILGGFMLFQLFMIFQRLYNYIQQSLFLRKIRVTNNTTTLQIEQFNETNINQIFEMLDQKKNNINWKKI